MSIVPSNNPQAVFYLAIDNPKNTALLSSYTTAPIARKILLDIIDALKIKKQNGGIEKVKQWDDIQYVRVPNLIGKTISEAIKECYPVEIDVSGNGKYVKEQSPNPGEKVDIKSKIRILLSE
jgi:stage V sporulation protein D (sporulation-specific penicillin-binding protein)